MVRIANSHATVPEDTGIPAAAISKGLSIPCTMTQRMTNDIVEKPEEHVTVARCMAKQKCPSLKPTLSASNNLHNAYTGH